MQKQSPRRLIERTAPSLDTLTTLSDVLTAISEIKRTQTTLTTIHRDMALSKPDLDVSLSVGTEDPTYSKIREAARLVQQTEQIAKEGLTACQTALSKADDRLAQACLAEAESFFSRAQSAKPGLRTLINQPARSSSHWFP